jgi:hypothetical protein
VAVSRGWNTVVSSGGCKVGEPRAPGPGPVTTTRRTADHAPGSTSGLTACTRQNHVPGGRPLTTSSVVSAPTSSTRLRSATDAKVEDALTSQW